MRISDKVYRRAEFLAPEDDEAFLRALNHRIAEEPPPNLPPTHPLIFIAGAPRSGTTLLAQAITNHFDIGFIDGLAARFWLAPVTGFRLSRGLFGTGTASGFESRYGRGATSDIHSFHYFWMHHLKLIGVPDLFSSTAEREVDWPKIIGHLGALQAVHGGPFAFKGYYPSYFMEAFSKQLPPAIFVIIRRNPLAVAESIYEARLSNYGDPARWFSLQPPGVEDLLHLPAEDQIAGQIVGLNRHFDDQIARAGGTISVIEVDYKQLTENPALALAEIGEDIARLSGERIVTTGVLPTIAAQKGSKVEPAVSKRLRVALRNCGVPV